MKKLHKLKKSLFSDDFRQKHEYNTYYRQFNKNKFTIFHLNDMAIIMIVSFGKTWLWLTMNFIF